jgi:hypothetical protein
MDSLDLHGEELRMYTVLDGHGGKGAVTHCKRTILLNIRQFLQYETEYTLEECLKQSFIKTEQNLTLLYQHSAPDLSDLLIDSVPGLESEVQLPLTSETQLDIWPPPPLTSIIPKHFKVKKLDDDRDNRYISVKTSTLGNSFNPQSVSSGTVTSERNHLPQIDTRLDVGLLDAYKRNPLTQSLASY